MVHSYIALDSGRLDDVAPRYAEMLDLLETSRDPVRWYQCVPRSLQCGLPSMREPSRRFAAGALARRSGDADAAARHRPRQLGVERRLVGSPGRGAEDGALAEADARWLGPPPNVRLALYSLLAVLFAMLGRRGESYGALDEILALFDDPGGGYRRDSPLYAFYRLFAIRLADWHGDGARVERLAGELDRVASADTPMLRPLLHAQRLVLRGRLAWHRGQWREARDAFGSALAHAVALRVFGEDVEVRLRLAHLCVRLGDVDGAIAAAAPVFDTAERDGVPGGALTCDRGVLKALADASWNGRLAAARIAALRRWLACLAAAPTVADEDDVDPGRSREPPGSRVGAPALVAAEALSPRELEVLKLIAAGDSNKLIARAFDLSPHTVKRHVANILDKLGVQSRGQAAAWYAERRPS